MTNRDLRKPIFDTILDIIIYLTVACLHKISNMWLENARVVQNNRIGYIMADDGTLNSFNHLSNHFRFYSIWYFYLI